MFRCLKFRGFQSIYAFRYGGIAMIFGLWANSLVAQSTANELPKSEQVPISRQCKLELSISTAGLGLGIGYRLNGMPWILRAKYSYLAGGIDVNSRRDSASQPYVNVHAQARMSHFSLLADYLLLANENFKITIGMAYHPHKTLQFEGTLRNFTYHQVVYTPDELGKVNIELSAPKISPYLGLGFGRSMSKKRIQVSGEVGIYYLMNWRVDTVKITNGIIVDNWNLKTGDRDLRNAINSQELHKILPNLNLMINYNF